MKTPQNTLLAAALAFTGVISGCATVMPGQLIDARNAYATSSQGLAGKLTPTELYDAKKVLDKANLEFEENGDTLECIDLAYVAQRKVQLADAKARTAQDRLAIADAVKAGVIVRDNQVASSQAALATTRRELSSERRANAETTNDLLATNDAQNRALVDSAGRLEAEKQARLSAEVQLAGAMKDLATIAAVKEEARGVVITLSGSVLFASGKYALLNTAKTKLDQVAEALKSQSPNKRMVVEGHTDSMGSDATNQPLSLSRATAVRDYLVSRGVSPERISAVGMGSSRAILDNTSAENRANNRRVEIVIGSGNVTSL